MTQEPLLRLGSTIKIGGVKVTIDSIHSGYVVAKDKRGKAKVFPFNVVENLFKE